MPKSLRDIIAKDITSAGRDIPQGEAEFLDLHKVEVKDYPVKQTKTDITHKAVDVKPEEESQTADPGKRHGYRKGQDISTYVDANEETELDENIYGIKKTSVDRGIEDAHREYAKRKAAGTLPKRHSEPAKKPSADQDAKYQEWKAKKEREEARDKARATKARVEEAEPHKIVVPTSMNAECNMTKEGIECPLHGIKECMSEGTVLKEKPVKETLHPNQKKLDKNKNGKLDADDFRKLRGEEVEQKEEVVDESYGDPTGKTATGTKWTKLRHEKEQKVSVTVHHKDNPDRKHTFTGYHSHVAKKLKTQHGLNMHDVKFKNAADMKEEVESVEEMKRSEAERKAAARDDIRRMSSGEMKKREDIVKEMKKNLPSFKKRYGERAKNVMYATATKMAQK